MLLYKCLALLIWESSCLHQWLYDSSGYYHCIYCWGWGESLLVRGARHCGVRVVVLLSMCCWSWLATGHSTTPVLTCCTSSGYSGWSSIHNLIWFLLMDMLHLSERLGLDRYLALSLALSLRLSQVLSLGLSLWLRLWLSLWFILSVSRHLSLLDHCSKLQRVTDLTQHLIIVFAHHSKSEHVVIPCTLTFTVYIDGARGSTLGRTLVGVSSIFLCLTISTRTGTDSNLYCLTSYNLTVFLHCEDHLDWSTVKSTDTWGETHKLEQVDYPWCTCSSLLVRDGDTEAATEAILTVISLAVLTTYQMCGSWMTFILVTCTATVVRTSSDYLLHVFRSAVDWSGSDHTACRGVLMSGNG